MILTRHPRHHGYLLSGQPIPSVSAILKAAGLSPQYADVEPAVLEKARNRGIAVHAACEALDKDESPPPLTDELKPYVNAYVQFRYDAGFTVIETEQALYHPQLLYAGTPDVVGTLNKVRALVDRKATYEINHTAVSVQAAAYRGAWNAQRPDQSVTNIYALHLRRDGTYRLHRYDADEAWQIFMAALAIFRFKKRARKGT